jgi:hypothetical protein
VPSLINGGTGDDSVFAEDGDDMVIGDPGDDLIDGVGADGRDRERQNTGVGSSRVTPRDAAPA